MTPEGRGAPALPRTNQAPVRKAGVFSWEVAAEWFILGAGTFSPVRAPKGDLSAQTEASIVGSGEVLEFGCVTTSENSGAFRHEIAGVVRFSYPAKTGYAISTDDEAALEAVLYEPGRLDRRFRLFERLTVPSLVSQTDADFRTILLVGHRMPDAALSRLETAIRPLRGAMILPLPALNHYDATRQAFTAAGSPGMTHLTGFRLDDDDALDRGFIARLRLVVDGLLASLAPERGIVVGHNRGLFLHLSTAEPQIYEVVEKLPIGIGLSMTVKAGTNENIFRRNHRLLPQYYSTFTDAVTPSFIRTIHSDNDSEPYASGQVNRLGERTIRRILDQHFPFTLNHLLGL